MALLQDYYSEALSAQAQSKWKVIHIKSKKGPVGASAGQRGGARSWNDTVACGGWVERSATRAGRY